MPLSKAEIQAILKEVRLGHPFTFMGAAFDYRDGVEPIAPDPSWRPHTIRVGLWVADRDTGEATRLYHMVNAPYSFETRGEVLALARKALHEVLLHEADEAFLAAGVRVFDPHR